MAAAHSKAAKPWSKGLRWALLLNAIASAAVLLSYSISANLATQHELYHLYTPLYPAGAAGLGLVMSMQASFQAFPTGSISRGCSDKLLAAYGVAVCMASLISLIGHGLRSSGGAAAATTLLWVLPGYLVAAAACSRGGRSSKTGQDEAPLGASTDMTSLNDEDNASAGRLLALIAAPCCGCCEPTRRPQPRGAAERLLACSCCFWGWLAVVLGIVLSVGYAATAAALAGQDAAFPPTGQLYSVAYVSPPTAAGAAAGSNTSLTMKLHLYCTGSRAPGSSLFVFEAGAGASSLSFLGAQMALANSSYGRRSCAYDRPGFGWSDLSPAPMGQYAALLRSLLQQAGEEPPYTLVGHSAGGELVQLYAAAYASDVTGVAILDGYPDYLQLLAPVEGYSLASLPALRQPVTVALQLASAMEPFGLTRVIANAASFQPAEKAGAYLASYNNGRNWRAQMLMWSGQDNTQQLAALAGAAMPPWNPANGLKWPRLAAHIKVLVAPASSTVWGAGKSGPDAGNPVAWAYWQQALLYNATLSPVSRLQVCSPCEHSFPWEHGSDWLAPRLAQYFS